MRSGTVAAALGEERPAGPVHNDMDFAPNTNVIGHHGTTLAIVEAGALPYELGYELDTIGSTDLAGGLDAGYTAHPKVDPATGELHAVSYFWGWGNQVQYTVVDTAGKVVTKRMVETTGSPMLHDMSLTERYAVVYDLPVVFDLDAAMAGAAMPYFWQDDYPARLGLIDRTDVDGPVRWLDVDPCYVFHPMNAYDDGDDVVIDVVRWDGMFRKGAPGPVRERAALQPAALDARPDRRARSARTSSTSGRRSSRGSTSASSAAAIATATRATIGGVTKHDLDAARRRRSTSAPRPARTKRCSCPPTTDAAEDDGWLLCLTYDGGQDTSALTITHAQDLAAGPVATVHLDRRVPFGFHGNWVPDA